jgi:hypothetical protein
MTADAAPETCSECGAEIVGGRDACQRLFQHYSGLARTDIGYGGVHWLLVDAYCMQHVESHGKSAKSYAAHLIGLCWGVERGGGPAGYAAIPRWLDGNAQLERPASLSHRGAMTLVDVARAADPSAHRSLVAEWARDVWQAYAPQHELAREWLSLALSTRPRRRS